jgi:hypothetical protein
MGDACAVVAAVLLLCAVIGHWFRPLRALSPPRLWRWWRQRAERRFYREMCRRWGDDPIPRWHHDERARSREMRLRRAHNARS